MSAINVTVSNSDSGSISVSNVTDGSEVSVSSSSTPSVSLTVGAGAGPIGTDVALAAGTGISIAQANNTATISSTVTSVVNLTDLSDVTNTTPSSGQVLAYNGTAWEATTQSGGSGSSNLTLTDDEPQALGTGAVGTSTDAARADHVHNMPTFAEITNGTATTSSNLTLDAATGVVIVQGGSGGSAALTLNCEENSHGVTIQGPAHSAGATYTLTLPTSTGLANQLLTTDGNGLLSWSTAQSFSGLEWVTAPESSTSAGAAGQIAYDSNRFLYFHTGTEWVRSQFVTFTVDVTVTIVTQPQDASVAPYSNPSFTVTASASDLQGVTYQWQQSTDSGTTWADISSETSASFSLSGVTTGDSGKQFRVVVTSSSTGSATATSQAAVLTVGEFDYILDEGGNILTDEGGNRLTHEGATSAPSGGGSSSSYEALFDTSRMDGILSALTMLGATASTPYSWYDYPSETLNFYQSGAEFGASKIFLNGDGSQIYAAHNSGAYIITDDNQDFYTPELRYEKEKGHWYPIQAPFLSGTDNNVKRAWLPRSISKASNADVIAGLHQHKDGSDPKTVTLEVIKGDDTLFETKTLITEHFDYIAELNSTFIQNGPSSWFDQQELVYNTALSSNGQYVIVCIPYVSTTTSGASGYENGIVKVFEIGTNAVTQVGSDIQPFTGSGSTGNTGWEIGALACRVSDDGTAIAFTGGPYGSEVLHRYDLVNSSTWTARATLTPSSNLRKTWSITKDCNRVAVGDSSSNNRAEIYDYDSTTDAWTSSATISALSNTDEFGSAVSLSDDGDVLAVGARNSNDPTDTSNSNHGAAVLFERDSSSGSWQQLTDVIYGSADNAKLGSQVALSGDGYRVAVQSEKVPNNTSTGGVEVFYRQRTATPNYTPGYVSASTLFHNLDLAVNHPVMRVFNHITSLYMRAPSGFTTYQWQYKPLSSSDWSTSWWGPSNQSDELQIDRNAGDVAGSITSRISPNFVNYQYRCLLDAGLSTEAVTQPARYIMYRGNQNQFYNSNSITATSLGSGYVYITLNDKFDYVRRVASIEMYLERQVYQGTWSAYAHSPLSDSNGKMWAELSDPPTYRKANTYDFSSVTSSSTYNYRVRVVVTYVDGVQFGSGNTIDLYNQTHEQTFYSNGFVL